MLAEGSGVPVAYWADERVAALQPEAVERGTAPAALAEARLGPSAVFEPDAKDPRALVMPDDSMGPVIERGQVVIYDAAAPARVAGELVVTRVGGGLTVRRRVALGKGWIYLAADASCPAIAPSSSKPVEHPVVAVIMKPRRAAFYLRDGVWWDSTVDMDAKRIDIRYLSDEYFALSRKSAVVGKYLALGERVVFVLDGTTYVIVP